MSLPFITRLIFYNLIWFTYNKDFSLDLFLMGKYCRISVPPAGLEPATHALKGRCSNATELWRYDKNTTDKKLTVVLCLQELFIIMGSGHRLYSAIQILYTDSLRLLHKLCNNIFACSR